MSISSQLPHIPLAQAGADLRALALSVGKTVEARVGAKLPSGMTQVLIGGQALSLQLPSPQPPGTVLTLSVQQAQGQLTLALMAARPPDKSVTTNLPQASLATNIQLSATALAQPARQAVISADPMAMARVQVAAVSAASAAATAPGPGSLPVSQVGYPSPPGPTTVASQSATHTPSPVPPAATTPASGSTPTSAPVSAGPTGASGAPVAPSVQQPVGSAPTFASAGVTVSGASQSPVGVPYAVAAPASVAPAAPAAANSLLQPVQQTTAATLVGQHAPSMGNSSATVAPPPVAVSANVQTALHQMVHAAAPRQDSVLGLMAVITSVAGKVVVPEPVAKAMQQVLAQRLSISGGKFDGASLQKAVQQSGIFQEAMIAAGQVRGVAGDMKTSLLGLQRQLLSWLGNQAPVEEVSSVPPPIRGQVPRATANSAAPRVVPLDPQEAGKVLLERTEAALSRLRLHQNASLPDPLARQEGAQWSLDLPVVVGSQQALLQMQIHRDSEKDDTRPEDRGWQVRFAINLDEAGEVGAQISLRGVTTGVLIWADRADVADRLALEIEALREELASIGLMPGAVIVRAGSPVRPPVQPSTAGHFVDARR